MFIPILWQMSWSCALPSRQCFCSPSSQSFKTIFLINLEVIPYTSYSLDLTPDFCFILTPEDVLHSCTFLCCTAVASTIFWWPQQTPKEFAAATTLTEKCSQGEIMWQQFQLSDISSFPGKNRRLRTWMRLICWMFICSGFGGV